MSRSAPTSGSSRPNAGAVREIHRRLKQAYGPLDPPRRLDPLEELVLTILSQNTSDVNRDRAYAAMRRRYPSWDALARARERDLAEVLRPGGLAGVKAPRLLAVLRQIRERHGRLDLSWLREASDEEATRYLMSLPGVGPKTAACVLAFSLDRPALPVDTHVHRVATRLGWVPPGMPAWRAHRTLEDLVPPRIRVGMHVALIRHGRALCRAGRPLCERCPVRDLCPTAPRYLGSPTKSDKSRSRPSR